MRLFNLLKISLLIITINSSCLLPAYGLGDKKNKADPKIASITITAKQVREISSLLLGFNVVYPHESDHIWKDGKITGILKDVKVSLIRYPGGTVSSFYHWNNLSGNGWADKLDPDNKLADRKASDFMDIDEYMELIGKTGAQPLVGINVSSARRWNKLQEGIDEALELMKYCREKKFRVKYWYIDNEPYQPDSNGGRKTPEEYAGLINSFAEAMKNYDPEIQIVANWNASFENRRADYEKLIKTAGKNIDIIDVHWYWGWRSNKQMEQWLSETPMRLWTKSTYINEINYFRKMVSDFGYPGIKLASFEWNVGPGGGSDGLTDDQCALIQGEMLMQFIIGGLDMAVFWPLHWPDKGFTDRAFINTSDNSVKANYKIFSFMSGFQGGILMETAGDEPGRKLLNIAAFNADRDTMRICILDKNKEGNDISLRSAFIKNMKISDISAFKMKDPGNESELISLSFSRKKDDIRFTSPGVSLTMITMVKK